MSKRAVVGFGVQLPNSVAVVLARLMNRASPVTAATAKRCAPKVATLLTRFAYPSGPVDVIESIGCGAGAVAYVQGRGYLLPALLASYLQSATDPSTDGLVPEVMGEPLTKAGAAARQAGDTIELAGELADESPAGTVLLQSPTLDHRIGVIVAVHRGPPCRAAQLAVQYLPGGAGTGSDFGRLLLRNVSASWCELDGTATITGLATGKPVTRRLAMTLADDLELSPHASATVPGHRLPADQLAGSVLLSAEYRDDIDGSSCTPHWIVPTRWRITVNVTTLTVANGRATSTARPPGFGGLITCRGAFGATEVQVASS